MEWSLNVIVKKSGMVRVMTHVALILNLVVFFMSCDNTKDNLKFRFYYYPQQNLYYDIKNQKFYYSLNAAKSWKEYFSAINNDAETLGHKIEIASDDSVIYASNREHVKLYGGQVYDYNLQNTALVGVSEVNERKVTKKVPVVKPKIMVKQKKGIGKFIDKIFGKDKKK